MLATKGEQRVYSTLRYVPVPEMARNMEDAKRMGDGTSIGYFLESSEAPDGVVATGVAFGITPVGSRETIGELLAGSARSLAVSVDC